jgi:hypothetical protein
MIPSIQELFEKCCTNAADDLMRDGEVQFEVVFLTKDNKLIVCGSAMPEAVDERDGLVSMLRLIAVAHGAAAAGIISEVWFDPDRQDHRRPSESPNRREALVVWVMYRDQVGISVIESKRDIIRDISGKIIELLPANEPPEARCCDETEGRLMRIIPREEPSRHDRRRAMSMINELPIHLVQRVDCGDETAIY